MSNPKPLHKIIVCPETSKIWFVFILQPHIKEGKTIDYYSDGSKQCYLNDELHREDGPAVEFSDGSKFWYQNGKRHREDGPAVECSDGPKEWHLNGRLHRENGPALEFSDGRKYWYLNGKELSEKEFKNVKF